MGTIVLAPDNAGYDASYWAAVGGTMTAVLSDALDGTYGEFDEPGTGDRFLYVFFADLAAGALPTNAYITLIAITIRDRKEVTAPPKIRSFWFSTIGQPFQGYEHQEVTNTTFADQVEYRPVDVLGQPWTAATINGFYVAITGYGDEAPNYYISKVQLAVAYNEVPAPVITGPASPVTTTSKPTFTWTVNDPDGDSQNRYQLVIRNAGTATIVYDTGIVFANTQTHQITTPLPNGNYDITLSLGDAVNPNMSPFTAIYPLTITAPLPGVPLLAATPQPAANRVKLDLTTVAGSVYTSYFGLERSDDGGVTWQVVQDQIASDWGLLLDGVDDWLTIGDFNDFTGTSAFTLEAKLARIAAGTADVFVNKSNATDGYGMSISTGAALVLARSAGGVGQNVAAGAVPTGSKTNLAGTYDGTNLRVYIEGAIVGAPTASAASLSNNAVDFTLGGSASGGNSHVVIFEARVWNTARSAGNLLANKDADLVGNEANLVDLWEFDATDADGGDGITVASKVVGGHTATFVGEPVWVPATATAETFYDYTAPQDVLVQYRAFAVHDDGTVFTLSSYSGSNTALLPFDNKTWLKVVSDPALNMGLTDEIVLEGPEGFDGSMAEDMAIFTPLGREFPVIFGGTIRSEYFSRLRFFTIDDAARDALLALRGARSTVLLQTCFGDGTREQKFLRLGRDLSQSRRTHGGQNRNQGRSWEIEAWEVEQPTSQGQ